MNEWIIEVSNSIYLFFISLSNQQIIEAYLWSVQLENSNFFAADTTVFQLVAMGGSTRRLWKDVNFKRTEVMVVPMNITTRHWTLTTDTFSYIYNLTKECCSRWLENKWNFHLQAVDVKLNVRWYFDSLHSKERKIDGTSDNLCSLIDNIRCEYDLRGTCNHLFISSQRYFTHQPLFFLYLPYFCDTHLQSANQSENRMEMYRVAMRRASSPSPGG